MAQLFVTNEAGENLAVTPEQAQRLRAAGHVIQISDDVDSALAPLDTGRAAPAVRDVTRVQAPGKPVAPLEYLANQRAAEAAPEEQHPFMPRLAAAHAVDTTQYARPTGPQRFWAGTKDIASLPGRLLTGGAAATLGLADVPSGEGNWASRALQNYRENVAKVASAPTDLGNQGGVAGFVEGSLKDPLNVILPASGAAVSAATKLPAIAKYAPLLRGAAGVEDAALARNRMTQAELAKTLHTRAEAGTDAAINAQLESLVPFEDPEFGRSIGLVEGHEGQAAAREGYLQAAERGVASEVDPLLGKLQADTYTPAKFPSWSPDRVRQVLGNLQNYADMTASGAKAIPVMATRVGLPVANAALRGGVPAAIYGSLDEAMSGQPVTAESFGANLLGGTAAHGIGTALKARGTASFPGAEPAAATSRGPSKSVRATVQENMDQLIGQGILPTTTSTGYLRQAEAKLADLGSKYKTAARAILPSEVVAPADVVEAAKAKLAAYAQHGADVHSGQIARAESDLPGLLDQGTQFERPLHPAIQNVLDEAYGSMLGKQHVFATPTGLIPEGTKPRAAAKLRKEYEANVNEQLENPSIPANALLDLRSAWNSPSIYTDPAGAVAQKKKLAYQALHDAANDILAQQKTTGGKTYGQLLTEAGDLPRQYALWSSFRDVLHSPRQGLQHRISTELPLVGKYMGNSALSHYFLPSMSYYGGRVVHNVPGLGLTAGRALADTTGAR